VVDGKTLCSDASLIPRKTEMHLTPGSATDDATAIANLIWETDPEMCAFVFGNRQIWRSHCAIEWLAAIGLHSLGSATVARDADATVGLIIAFPQEEMTRRYAATVARYPNDIGQRMETVGWLFPVLPENALYVFNLAVSKAHRGRGVGRQLLSAAEEQAQSSGLTSVHLDVAANTAAVQFYERMGYGKMAKTELLEPKSDIPSHLRMIKTFGG
jgi:ribosomal protein S18 acetylase RimI-like enzyme